MAMAVRMGNNRRAGTAERSHAQYGAVEKNVGHQNVLKKQRGSHGGAWH